MEERELPRQLTSDVACAVEYGRNTRDWQYELARFANFYIPFKAHISFRIQNINFPQLVSLVLSN